MLRHMNYSRKGVILLMSVFISSGLFTAHATADIISTEILISESRTQQLRDDLSASLAHSDVIERLKAQGVDPEHAAERVAALSDDELETLAAQFDELPAGGDVTLLLVVIILVLLLR